MGVKAPLLFYTKIELLLYILFERNVGMKGNIKEFVSEAFDYRNQLVAVSIDRSVNRYLLEYIAAGLVDHGGVAGFIEHVDVWLRTVCKVFREIGFDEETNQVRAVIDLQDQLVVIDQRLYEDLEYVTNIIEKYGLLIEYNRKGSDEKRSTTLCRFFEDIEGIYPVITDRYKGLGSSEAKVSKEILMNPKTRRLIKVTMEDSSTLERLGVLMGDSKAELNSRKEMLMNFKFDKSMIDN